MYGDHSLLVVEAGFLHTRIKEYPIVGGTNHVIESAAKKTLKEWKFSASEVTQMKVVPVPATNDLVILLCTHGNKIVFIPVIARDA
jgi:hypothetical protein